MILVTLVSIIQSFSISLGVGSSTLAILNFFAAIADGKIEPSERRMMGIVYIILRIAMILILGSTAYLVATQFSTGETFTLSAFAWGQITIIGVLFLNAILMTAHIMPSALGPSIQAGSWYTLGTLAALLPLGLTNFTYLQFFLGYATWVVLATIIVNMVMLIMKDKQKKKAEQPTKNPA